MLPRGVNPSLFRALGFSVRGANISTIFNFFHQIPLQVSTYLGTYIHFLKKYTNNLVLVALDLGEWRAAQMMLLREP